ncbi:MAG: transcriptional regulator [Chloroflexia bacterium]|nr:transcriptional regulator [Chloroflexia bacterium]
MGKNKRLEDYVQAEIDQMIHSPARLKVMTYLYVVENADFVYLARLAGLTAGNLSSHLSKLEEAGYVIIEKDFKEKKPLTIISLSDEGREAFLAYKRHMEQMLGKLPA